MREERRGELLAAYDLAERALTEHPDDVPLKPGDVYVTEAFAAALVLAGNRELTCEYVGLMAATKGYGRLRMYRLRRVSPGDDPVR